MRIAIDSNLIISSTFKLHTPPALVLAAWRAQRFEWVSCTEQMEELTVALTRPRVLNLVPGGISIAQLLLQEMQRGCNLQTLQKPLPSICRDERDDFLFALFDQGFAELVISGDKDVLALQGRYPVITAREFLDRL
jgi:putative PIN family toxin of toxin-antitoxin system